MPHGRRRGKKSPPPFELIYYRHSVRLALPGSQGMDTAFRLNYNYFGKLLAFFAGGGDVRIYSEGKAAAR